MSACNTALYMIVALYIKGLQNLVIWKSKDTLVISVCSTYNYSALYIFFVSFTCVEQHITGSTFRLQLNALRKISIPAFTSLTAHSPGLTPFRSPSGPMHRVAATGFPVVFRTWTAHSASSTCSKYWTKQMEQKTIWEGQSWGVLPISFTDIYGLWTVTVSLFGFSE